MFLLAYYSWLLVVRSAHAIESQRARCAAILVLASLLFSSFCLLVVVALAVVLIASGEERALRSDGGRCVVWRADARGCAGQSTTTANNCSRISRPIVVIVLRSKRKKNHDPVLLVLGCFVALQPTTH